MVFALAGDSTITSVLAITTFLGPCFARRGRASEATNPPEEPGGPLYYYGPQSQRQECPGHPGGRQTGPLAHLVEVGRIVRKYREYRGLRGVQVHPLLVASGRGVARERVRRGFALLES